MTLPSILSSFLKVFLEGNREILLGLRKVTTVRLFVSFYVSSSQCLDPLNRTEQ
jgi:hypothetical protein